MLINPYLCSLSEEPIKPQDFKGDHHAVSASQQQVNTEDHTYFTNTVFTQ
jgi:hypothetical protein